MEFVYVVKRYKLFDRSFPHGFRRPWEVPLTEYLDRIRTHGFFVERRHAETDSEMKQIIPYCVLLRPGEVFLLRRRPKGGESRLFHLQSIGVGGHINPVDREGDPLAAGLERELLEEVAIDGDWDATPLGIINDESQDVGSVHFGLVYGVKIEGDVRIREVDQLEGRWASIPDLLAHLRTARDSFESWSALILDRIEEVAGR